jgi:hypothetical protein
MQVHAVHSLTRSPEAPLAAARTHERSGAAARPAAPSVHERLDRVELIARSGLLTVDRARELLGEQHGPLDLALAAVRPARRAL